MNNNLIKSILIIYLVLSSIAINIYNLLDDRCINIDSKNEDNIEDDSSEDYICSRYYSSKSSDELTISINEESEMMEDKESKEDEVEELLVDEVEFTIPHYKFASPKGEVLELSIELQDYTYEMCTNYGIEDYYVTILAQMCKESKYESSAISSSNDYGLMQINKVNHEWLSEELGIEDFLDPYQNIKAGVYLMGSNLEEYDISTSLSKYNTGKPYNSTTYSKDVLNNYLPYMVEF